jgi:carbon storage regulator
MLVLTRKLMEKLYIGDAICVTVVRLEGGQVRLGIDAPKEIRVVRAELTDESRPREPAADDAARPPLRVRGNDTRRRGPFRSNPRRPPFSYEGS